MCEGYLIGGDAFVKIEEDTRCCQTFTPTYTHTVAYLDLDCKFCDYYRRPTILITTTDEDHKPTDNIITTGRTSWLAKYPTDELVRARFNLTWATLDEGVEYAIVIYYARPGTGQYLYWQYDAAGATYDRGIRLLSLDRGETWTPYPDSDHMFFEFGKEPAPLPSPDPPVKNFAILDLQQEVTATGIILTVTTNVPCHLYCYWTDHEPQKHLIPILTRGIQLHTQLQYCFVDWHENEQEEAGDTLTHTFTKEPWAHCETRWLTFRAKVMDEWVKSVGPIFKKHRVYTAPPPPSEFEHYEGDPDFTGYIYLNRREGMTFTPQVSHHISSVKLLLRKVGTPGPLHVYIYPTTDGKPSGGLLCEGQIDAATISDAPNYTWKEIELGAGADLLVDVMYAITTYAFSTFGPWHNVQWGICPGLPVYPRGHRVYSPDGGSSWSIWDYRSNFSVWGYLT